MSLFCDKKSSKLIMLCLLLAITGTLSGMIYLCYRPLEADHVVLNEICSNNFTLAKNENEKYCDYIELYNPTSEAICLEGYFLSDDENDLQKYALDYVWILPKDYYVVWLDEAEMNDNRHRKFGISSAGEEIFLSNAADEKIIDSVMTPEIPYNTCYGRVTNGGKEWACMSPTIGNSNSNADILPLICLKDPSFSAESGFYDEAFQLTITAPEDELICYTLDGTEPTPNSAQYVTPLNIGDASSQENVYSARTDLSPTEDYIPPFKVDKATIVRAISYNPKENTVSKIVTKVYFVGYEQRTEYSDFPIVSLVTDPGNLFDIEHGIYTNGVMLEEYKSQGGIEDGKILDEFTDEEGERHFLYEASNAFNDGKEWERGATLSYFDNRHQYCFTQNVGIQIAGQSTRGTPQKSFSIYGREIYDKNIDLPYEFYPGTKYSSIKLRNGGNENAGIKFKDALLEEQAVDRAVAIQRSMPCILFLNGEYWGIYNIRERYKEEYIQNHYGIEEDNVWIIDAGTVRTGDEKAQSEYQYMLDMIIDCDLSYDDVYAMICEIVDIQSLIDYYCINLYLDNRDVSFIQNTALWRCAEPDGSKYGDGRWRFMVFDLDDTLYHDGSLTWMEENDLMKEPVIQSLMRNGQFRKQFCTTFMDIANTTYSYDVVHNKLMAWKNLYETQLVKNHQRFFDNDYSVEAYENDIDMMDEFFRNRLTLAADGLAREFNLSGSLEPVMINQTEGGNVKVNTAILDECPKWTGYYFTDYPVTLTATPEEGYCFDGWNGDIISSETQVEMNIPMGGITVYAEFKKID